ncbi:haloacid dehalogenase-like hydrolase family protein, partial [Nannochloropsis oceanica]
MSSDERWRLLRRYTSPSAFSHPYDPQTIRRPFSIEQLRTAVTKALTKGLSALPSAPSLPPSLPFLRGSAASFKEGEGKIILYHFWRPSNPDSLAVLCKLEALLSLYGTEELMAVSILSPKYDTEEDKETAEAALRKIECATGQPLQQHAVLDRSLSMWKSKGLETWPSVAVALPGKQDKDGQRIIFLGARPPLS